jgi:hypothetical protein
MSNVDAEDERVWRAFECVAARVGARLQEDMTPVLARLLASAGEGSALQLVDGTGQVRGCWRSAEDLARDLVALNA